jgi:hypothetical protein
MDAVSPRASRVSRCDVTGGNTQDEVSTSDWMVNQETELGVRTPLHDAPETRQPWPFWFLIPLEGSIETRAARLG